MTLREKAIVTAYTGFAMCVHDELNAFYQYVDSLGFHGLYTHDFARRELWDAIHEASKPDFVALCRRTDPEPSCGPGEDGKL